MPGRCPSTGRSLTYRARISGKKEEKRVDDFRKEVIKELEKKLGDDYKIFPQDRTKNNGFTAHGVCIRKKSENIGAVAYIDEALLRYAAGATSLERIADELIQQCRGPSLRNWRHNL